MNNTVDMKSYLRDISKYQRISPAEEKRLGRQIKNGDKGAFEKLINSNLGLVIHLANRYANKGIDYDDLVSEGNLGLTVAASKWSPSKKVRFSTYAYFWIKRQMLYTLNTSLGQVRTPTNLAQIANSFHGRIKKLENEGVGKLTEQEIKIKFGSKYKNHPINSILSRINTTYCALVISGNDGSTFERSDRCLRTESFERELENVDGSAKLKKKIQDILDKTRYGGTVSSMFGLKDGIPHSGRAIARKNRVSVQTVHNWKKETFKKFKKHHKEKEFRDYLKVE